MNAGAPTASVGQTVSAAASRAFGQVVAFLPAVLGAVLLLAAGCFLGSMAARLSARLLRRLGFQQFSERIGFSYLLQKAGVVRTDASGVLGQLVNWILRLLFLQMAAETVGLIELTHLLNQLLAFTPNILAALLIMLAAGFLGQVARGIVRGGEHASSSTAALFADAAYWSTVAFGLIAALNQLRIAPVVVNTLFIGLVATVALAVGLSFGLGGREVAAELTREWARRAREGVPEARRRIEAAYPEVALETEEHEVAHERPLEPRVIFTDETFPARRAA